MGEEGLLRGLLVPVIAGLAGFILPWTLYRWGVLKGRVGRFAHPIRLLIYLVALLAFLIAGGNEILHWLDQQLGILLAEPGAAEAVEAQVFRDLADTFLYIVGALLVAALIDAIVFEIYLTERLGRHIPKLLRDAFKFVLIMLTAGYVTVKVWDVDGTALGGGAAVLTLVLGLALQNVLGDLFSGVVLQVERPFVKGDWIHVGEYDGEVVEINWRATRLNTRKNIGVVIPNSVMAKSEIRNLNLNTSTAAVDLQVGVEYREPPNRIKSAVLEACLQCQDVLRQPAPLVWTVEYGDSAIIYQLRFWIRDFRRMPVISDQVMTNIWYVFKRYGITIPWPIRNVYMRTEEEATPQERSEQVIDILRRVDIFTPLTRNQLEELLTGSSQKYYGSGEVLIRQGEEGDTFFVIESGQVEVLVESTAGGAARRVAMLGPQEFFGEMSLLAGDRRTATIRAVEDTHVVIIGSRAFSGVIETNPQLAAEMATIYYTRSEQLARLQEKAKAEEEEGAAATGGEKALLRRIQRFFGL